MAGSTEHLNDGTPPSEKEWFREPTPREHRIAAGLFIGFGAFFVTLFIVTAGFWFRWVILALGIYSVLLGMRHVRALRRPASTVTPPVEGVHVD